MKNPLYKKITNSQVDFKLLSLLFISVFITNQVQAGVNVSQFPLITSGGAADHLVLVPSVEWPTINSVSNLGSYNSTLEYGGYFDSTKCYKYQYATNESDRHFYPVGFSTNMTCSHSNKEWSGNYLNWAATQTIDPFRSALTGGYRVKDTVTETWLEKARHDGQGGTSIYPDRRVPASGNNESLVKSITPFDEDSIKTFIQDKGNRMLFILDDQSTTGSAIPYNPDNSIEDAKKYEVSIRVKVCVNGLLEQNCVKYGSNYKPEGVIQEYSNRLKYSAFGYLNDSSTLGDSKGTVKRDGAALRAKQKSVGPYKANLNNEETQIDNPLKEWSATTGILIANPSPSDASATNSSFSLTGTNAIVNSGIINYINKFGQMTGKDHKSYDAVSEMYYAALRYIRNKGNVPEYSAMSGLTPQAKYEYADGFPVINNWGDPFDNPDDPNNKVYCQASAFLGIGDVNTHRDKNLPGNTTYRDAEPGMPTLVSSDDINVITLTNKVGDLEGISNLGSTNSYTGRYNSAHIAGMAWYANTHDIRSDLAGKQTAATFWVDVLEGQKLLSIKQNQYALAAKYGGFRVPENFNPSAQTEALPLNWWHTNTDTLNPATYNNSGQPTFERPDNYFIASRSDQIVDSIKQVFARIVARVNGTGAGLASNSTKMVTGSKVFQSVFFNKSWHGDLKAYTVDAQTGQLNPDPDWQASDWLRSPLPLNTWSTRPIYLGSSLFTWSNLSSTEKTALLSESVVNYLRGDDDNEQHNGGAFRDRFITPLGDIVHSQPVLVGRPSNTLYNGKTFAGATSYSSFANDVSARKAVLYVGANDGMLHSFNTADGKEVYAYIPKTLIPELKKLADPNYQHQYFVDGDLTVADAYFGGTWKTVLVGTLGAGGKAVFALDVTNPDSVQFLWEKNATDVPAIGNNLSKPVITQTADGQWKAIMGNGPNSTGDKAQLLMFDISNGNATTIDTGEGNNNGLSGVTAWSTYADGITDVLYAGDVRGNVWKFNPSTNTATKLFTAKYHNNPNSTAGNIQPITSTLLAGMDPENSDFWLFFGTGQYLSQSDLTDTSPQSWYGLKIKNDSLIEYEDLVKRRVLVETTNGAMAVRVSDVASEGDLEEKSGWYFNLPQNGERMVIPNIFQGDALIGTVRIPDASDICKPTGRGFVVAINPFTGGRLDRIFFDVNSDQEFDQDDNVMYQDESTAVSGVGFDSSPNSPLFIGHVMQVVQDDGNIVSILTQGALADAQRTSWHEIINTP
ncbi:MAG: PilC/PilY family type IV pilus protein [Thiolinea sp.]